MVRSIPNNRIQWIIDVAFGILCIGPVFYALIVPQTHAILVSIGAGLGFLLHVAHKMVQMNDTDRGQHREAVDSHDAGVR